MVFDKTRLEVRQGRDGGFVVHENAQFTNEDVFASTSIDEVNAYLVKRFSDAKPQCTCK